MWSEQWPTKPGHYWFWGWMSQFGKTYFLAGMHLVRVAKGASSLFYVTHGTFLYKSDAEGVWQEAVMPAPPDNATVNRKGEDDVHVD